MYIHAPIFTGLRLKITQMRAHEVYEDEVQGKGQEVDHIKDRPTDTFWLQLYNVLYVQL